MTVKSIKNDVLGTLKSVGCFIEMSFLIVSRSGKILSLYDGDHWIVALQKMSGQCHLIVVCLYLSPTS